MRSGATFHDSWNQFYAQTDIDDEFRTLETLSIPKDKPSKILKRNEIEQLATELPVLPYFAVVPANIGYTVVITHGYNITGSYPAWVDFMADSIRDRIDGGSKDLKFYRSEGLIRNTDGTYTACGTCNRVIQVDWADLSNDPARGYIEATGDAVFQALLTGKAQGLFSLSNLHFIGHSRGTVVNSEVVERLFHVDATVPSSPEINITQVTTLDPHDSGATGLIPNPWTDHDVNPTLEPPLGIVAWQGQNYSDNYYSINSDLEIAVSDVGLDGRYVNGAYDVYLGENLNHSDVWSWFIGTICDSCLKDILADIQEQEGDKDPKCYATASRLEDFIYATPLSDLARHQKNKLQKRLAEFVWKET